MAFNYHAAHQRMMVAAVKARGGGFGAVYDVSRWHFLSPGDSAKLAEQAGVVLAPDEVDQIIARWEDAEAADALALGREARKVEDVPVLWVAMDQEQEPRERQPVQVVKVFKAAASKDVTAVVAQEMVQAYRKAYPEVIQAFKNASAKVTPAPPQIKRIDFNKKT